jgi:hypothetical protein
MTLFPNFTPTWILTEKIYCRLQLLSTENKIRGYSYFKKRFETTDPHDLAREIAAFYSRSIKADQNGAAPVNEELRMLCCLLTGRYKDGTYYLANYSPLRSLSLNLGYFLFGGLSEWLMELQVESFVSNNPYVSSTRESF